MWLKNNRTAKLICGMLALLLIAIACQIGTTPADVKSQVQTAVAQTITAEIQSQPTLTPTPQIMPTLTSFPTSTAITPPTATPKPCNAAQFISETIPDNTAFDPNKSFTKTWRFKNVGTCTWNTNYKLVFSSGDKMSGSSSINFTESVAPGEQVDLGVDLEAPGSVGTYQGFWKVKDNQGFYFINNIWVKIKVAKPLVEKTVTLNVVFPESGTVWESGDVFPGEIAAGDAATNKGVQGFAAFDISGIPDSANILSVNMDFTDYSILGTPFALGCLRLYKQDYRPLNASDYFTGSPIDSLKKWCNTGELDTVSSSDAINSALQARLDKTYFQLRLQFNEHESNNNGINDAVGWNSMKLIVKYES
jgi:hypothetical protein